MRKITPLNGVENLVGLFQRVFANRVEGLFAIPGAAAGCPQTRHDAHRLLKQLRRLRRIGSGLRRRSICGMTFERNVHAALVYRMTSRIQFTRQPTTSSPATGFLVINSNYEKPV